MSPYDILFTQDTIDPYFQSEENVPFPWRGRAIHEAITEAENLGCLPGGLQINAVRSGDGRWITLNNRTLYVAQEANLKNVHPVDAGVKGTNKMTKLLRDAGLTAPVETVTVRPTK
ncbi:hypothetical protein MNBD_GAMMA23-1066 [hydrothermal vent metagenome]|uniref:Uncharacterized protein n=1 Tax=hydrothermal vent metagenome TaxID=652676 RepID=A0A3B0ZVK9_9ZZZZ